MAADCVEGQQLFEGSIDAVAWDMAMEETNDLILRQSYWGLLECFANTVGNGVTGGVSEEERSAGGAVIPNGESSLEVGQADDGAGVESSVDGAEAQDLGLGAAGRGAAQAGT